MPPARSTFRERCRRSRRWSKAGFANIPISGCGCIAAGDSTPPPQDEESSPRLYPRPQPVDDTLRRRIARGDHEQLFQSRLIGVDVLVIEDFRIDQLLARQIAIGVGQEV